MNEFTLEELYDIHGAVTDTLVAMVPHLADKIQSMIDNYCNHQWDNMCCGCEIYHVYCVKCDERLLNE